MEEFSTKVTLRVAGIVTNAIKRLTHASLWCSGVTPALDRLPRRGKLVSNCDMARKGRPMELVKGNNCLVPLPI